MSVERKLKGRRVAVLTADGFEKVELTVPVGAMRARGAEVEIVSLRPGRIRGVHEHEPAARVGVDRTLAEANPADYDALLIPGGSVAPHLLRQSEAARNFVKRFDAERKPIASLCQGPGLLAAAGVTNGRTMTSWAGVRDNLINAGATWLDRPVVHDGNWLTSRGREDIVPFVTALVDHFSGRPPAVPSAASDITSSPQRRHARQLAVSAMKRLPGPTLRTAALLLGAVALCLLASRRRSRRWGPIAA